MTTPSLLQAMVGIVTAIADDECPYGGDCLPGGNRRHGECRGCRARAALDAWGKRPRLRDEPEVMRALQGFGAGDLSRQETADAIDALLYGERG